MKMTEYLKSNGYKFAYRFKGIKTQVIATKEMPTKYQKAYNKHGVPFIDFDFDNNALFDTIKTNKGDMMDIPESFLVPLF